MQALADLLEGDGSSHFSNGGPSKRQEAPESTEIRQHVGKNKRTEESTTKMLDFQRADEVRALRVQAMRAVDEYDDEYDDSFDELAEVRKSSVSFFFSLPLV